MTGVAFVVLLSLFLVGSIVAFRAVASSAERRIRRYVERYGGEVLSIREDDSLDLFGLHHGSEFYRVTYRTARGATRTANFRVPMLVGRIRTKDFRDDS
jgi:hypothetical protein